MAKKMEDSHKAANLQNPIKTNFPIVGIGASAGGLEAYESFFKNMPSNCGMAFILVSHLDPTHVSILPELIRKQTKMKVLQIEDGQKVAQNHIYVIPPNKDLSILNGCLYLMELKLPRGLNLPIDNFFRSLAQDQGSRAICVILSGTGTDGTLGLKEIKGRLGMVMVQDEESAKYDGMPRSAISTGLADYILAVEKLPDQLIKYTKHAIIKKGAVIDTNENKFQQALNKIFILLRSQTNHDFSHYKKNTICRRIERRMHVHQIDNIKDYVAYLQKSEREVHTLFKDLLIGVTSFFRDKEAFENLKNNFLIDLLKEKSDNYRVRVWIAGCSSGEEGYSIAILLHECMEQIGRHFDVQIFGTDIDEDAINLARSGLYPLSISADVSPKRLKRYFTKEESHYRVKKSIREMLIFAPQNLIKDPPFTKLDILSCRNLLIYLGPELQKKVLPVFHYSLKNDGVLFLGSSESIGQAADLFKIQDKKWKIFKREVNSSVTHPILDFPIPPQTEGVAMEPAPEAVKRAMEINSLMLVETILEQSDTPPCAIIDEKKDIIYIHGRTGRYLEPAVGKVSVNILEMARPGLKAVLAAVIRKVTQQNQEIVETGVEVQENNGLVLVDLIVKPLQEWGSMRGLIMVAFREPTRKTRELNPEKPKKDKALAKVEQELLYTKENLQTTIEELETSNEELKSTNEELQSTNEELQSTNEELETSKEELQSLNEESATVNAELQSRIDELSKATDDMKNLLDSTQIATIFLDIDLCIRRFTPRATKLVPLSNTDIGRPISHFATELKNVKLTRYADKVLQDLAVQEDEVRSMDDRLIKIRVLPYRTTQNVIDGVVITFEDITQRKLAEQEMEERRVFFEAVLECSESGILACDKNGMISYYNNASRKFHGLPLEPIPPEEWTQYYDLYETDGKTPMEPGNSPLFCALKGETVLNQECVIAPKGLPARKISVTGQMLSDSKGKKLGAMVTMNDITKGS
jgi:two-component system CheB/CheR fusion protein